MDGTFLAPFKPVLGLMLNSANNKICVSQHGQHGPHLSELSRFSKQPFVFD